MAFAPHAFAMHAFAGSTRGVSVSLGLGGILRDRLIVESDVVSCWPLHEIAHNKAGDILYGKNPGSWVGASGFTTGVSIDLPEGMIANHFDGNGYVLVAHDGDGYRWPGDSGQRSLSLAAGDIDVVFLIQTVTNDATLRAIVQKQETDSAGLGWHVAMQNGAIEFYLKVAAGEVFSFQRGAVADGALHLVHCTYNSVDGEASILVDGEQSGAVESVTPTDPELNTGDLRIGAFNDGVAGDGNGFIGRVCYVTVSRNGNPSLSTDLQATRAWTDVTDDLRGAGESLECISGMAGTTLKDRMAGTGTVAFTLDNGFHVTQGYYTIGHASQRSGFDIGIPVKFTEDNLIRFRGRLLHADPEPGVYKAKRVHCLAADWLELAARQDVTSIPIMADVRSDQAFAAVVDEADYPPVAVSLTAGSETFPFCFDRVSGKLLTELANVVASEGGFGYMRPDSTTGGVLTFEGRGVRQLDTTVDATFDQTMREMAVELGEQTIINVVRSTVTPRDAGATDTAVLYRQDRRIRIGSGETVVVEAAYKDPDQSRSAIGGTDFQSPLVAGTDYTFTENEDGTGTVFTANLALVEILGGSGFKVQFTNPSISPSGWLDVQVRGRALYTDTPVTVEDRDEASVRTRGRRPLEVSYPYLDSPETARNLAQVQLQLFSTPKAIPTNVTFLPLGNAVLSALVSPRAVGDLIALGDPVSALDVDTQRFWIQNERRVYRQGDIVEASFGVVPAFVAEDTPFAAWDETNWDDCVWGF